MTTDVVLASGNKGKIAEFQGALEPFGFNVIPQSIFNVSDVVEDGLSFVENAIIKARHASLETGLPSIADDSGIEANALNGAPGIFSARYAGEHGNDVANNIKLLAELQNQSDRSARFQCALAFVRFANDPNPIISQAAWHGEILEQTRGDNGFGYDPLFWIPALKKTSAEIKFSCLSPSCIRMPPKNHRNLSRGLTSSSGNV